MSTQTLLDAAAIAGTAILLGVTLSSETRQDPATVPASGMVEVVARRFAFEPDRIEVTEGDRVRLIVRSADGIHGFGIKKFRVNKVIPRGGDPVTIDFVASTPGTFEILCSEHCGDGHAEMKGALVVKARAK